MSRPEESRGPGDPRLGVAALHLFALGAFAIGQPVLAVLQRSPEFFVTRRSEPIDIVLMTLILLLAPGFVATSIVFIARWLTPALGRFALDTGTGGLFALGVLAPLSRFTELRSSVGLAVALVAGAVFGVLYDRSKSLRSLLTFAAPAPLTFGILFLLTQPVSRLVMPDTVVAGTTAGSPGDAPVVLIIFDELPAAMLALPNGEINKARFPNFAALSKKGDWFPNAFTVSDTTFFAVPSIVTGKNPQYGTFPTVTDHPQNLFTVLGNEYQMHVHQPVTDLCPPDVCRPEKPRPTAERTGDLLETASLIYPRVLFPRHYRAEKESTRDVFGQFLNVPTEQRHASLKAAAKAEASTNRPEGFRKWVGEIVPGKRRLHFYHAMLPHGPVEYVLSGKKYDNLGLGGTIDRVWEYEWLARQGQQRFLMQLQMVDRLIGELVTHLERVGMYDETLLIVTADHGVSHAVGTHARRLSRANGGYIAPVPLFIKPPNAESGRTHQEVVRTIDIFPTLMRLSGGSVPRGLDGRDLFTGAPRKPPYKVLSITGETFTFRSPQQLRSQATAEIESRFGRYGGPHDLFAYGPHAGLVGSPIAGFSVEPGTSLEARVAALRRLEDVDLKSETLPAHMRARAPGLAARPEIEYVAVVLNGIVASVVPLYFHEGIKQFSAMLPEKLFRQGRNELQLLGVVGSGRGRRLLTIRTRA